MIAAIDKAISNFIFIHPLKRNGYYIMSKHTRDEIKYGFQYGGIVFPPSELDFQMILKNLGIKEIETPNNIKFILNDNKQK